MIPLPGQRLGAVLAAGVLTVTLAGGATAQGPAASNTPVRNELDGTSWSLTGITAGAITTAPDGGGTLVFVGDQAGGAAGCDQFQAAYGIEATTLSFGPVQRTRMGCDEAWVTSYLTALSTAVGFSADAAQLTLMDAAGHPVLEFETAPLPSLEGTWRVTGLNDGAAMVTPDAGLTLTVAFQPGGRVQGDGGCNAFAGPFAVSASDISVGPLMSTILSCGETLDAQEQRYLTALQQAYTWSTSSGMLELRDYDGGLQVAAERAVGR